MKKAYKVYTVNEYGFQDKCYCYKGKQEAKDVRWDWQKLGIKKVMIKGRN